MMMMYIYMFLLFHFVGFLVFYGFAFFVEFPSVYQ